MSRRSSLILSWAAVILWMCLIFQLSAQPAVQSDSLSRGIIGLIMGALGRLAPEEFDMGLLNHLIRKSAHFLAYLVLGILVINGLRKSGLHGAKLAAALGICVLYAISDEFHQLFVPGRGCQISDVLIDSTGSLLGIIIMKFYHHQWNAKGNL